MCIYIRNKYAHIYTYMNKCTYIHIYKYIYTYIYKYAYICVHIYMYIYKYTHEHVYVTHSHLHNATHPRGYQLSQERVGTPRFSKFFRTAHTPNTRMCNPKEFWKTLSHMSYICMYIYIYTRAAQRIHTRTCSPLKYARSERILNDCSASDLSYVNFGDDFVSWFIMHSPGMSTLHRSSCPPRVVGCMCVCVHEHLGWLAVCVCACVRVCLCLFLPA